jgi:hypothetical protein
MKITKSELKEMIREALREELREGAFSGGVAGDNSINGGTVRGMGASTQPSKKNYLTRLKSKNPDLVDIMTVKGKDIKPGMITHAGQVKEAEVKYSNANGKKMVYIMHTNDYDGFWDVDEDMEVMVDPEDKSKPFAGEWRALLKMGLQESAVIEGIFGNKYKGKTILVYRGNGKEEAIAIGDTKAGNYNLINFQKAHAKKNNNDESDYANVAATDMAVKKYKQALKSIPDVTSNLPGWVNQYVKDAKAQRDQEFDNEQRQKERDAKAKRYDSRYTKNNSDDDGRVYVQGDGYGTYKYREGLEESLNVDSVFENLF